MATISQIDLAVLPREGGILSISDDVRIPSYGRFSFPRPATITLELRKLGEMLELWGSAQVPFAGTCDRCMEEFTSQRVIAIDEHLSLSEDSDPLGENNVVSKGVLDVADLLRQIVDVDTPMVLLCKDTCRGLCRTCGINLNEGSCDCLAATKGDHG